jgi:D-tyrosyl-tRNA(Tyr) deacylase
MDLPVYPDGAMRAVIQRVTAASVHVEGKEVVSIGPGLLVLLGVACEDSEQSAERLAAKIRALRVFADEQGRMNEPLGPEREILCVSQFTLYGDASRGNRPSFVAAAPGELARPLYEHFCDVAGAKRGVFGAHMQVALVNDGPVTLLLET